MSPTFWNVRSFHPSPCRKSSNAILLALLHWILGLQRSGLTDLDHHEVQQSPHGTSQGVAFLHQAESHLRLPVGSRGHRHAAVLLAIAEVQPDRAAAEEGFGQTLVVDQPGVWL